MKSFRERISIRAVRYIRRGACSEVGEVAGRHGPRRLEILMLAEIGYEFAARERGRQPGDRSDRRRVIQSHATAAPQ